MGKKLFNANGQTDRYDEANSRFSQFLRMLLKTENFQMEWNYDKSVSILTTLQVGQREFVVLCPIKPTEFSLLQSAMTLCGAPLKLINNELGGLFLPARNVAVMNLNGHLLPMSRLRMCGAMPLLRR